MSSFFFFNDTATTEIYTLSLHDALPISCRPDNVSERSFSLRVDHGDEDFHRVQCGVGEHPCSTAQIDWRVRMPFGSGDLQDRKSTRLNSSHSQISYAVFCLKKKNPRSQL